MWSETVSFPALRHCHEASKRRKGKEELITIGMSPYFKFKRKFRNLTFVKLHTRQLCLWTEHMHQAGESSVSKRDARTLLRHSPITKHRVLCMVHPIRKFYGVRRGLEGAIA